jgi:hypothetical protein
MCCVKPGNVIEENHTITMETRTFLLPTGGSLFSTAATVLPLRICLKSEDHEYYRPLLYTPTEFETSMSSVS